MSSKPSRTRKAANRDPTSLAIPASLPIKHVTPIDPQLLALNSDESNILLDCVAVDYTPPIVASPKSK